MSVWVYVFDSFKPVDIKFSKLAELAGKDPLQLFHNYVKHVVEDELGSISDVRIHDIYFNPKGLEFIIEYIVKCDLGEVSVKVIYSKDPGTTLMHYYEYERVRNHRFVLF